MSKQDKKPKQGEPRPVIHVDDDLHNADWLRNVNPRRVKRVREQPQVHGRSNPPMADSNSLSSAPWDGSASRFTPEQWRASCLADTGDGDPDSKNRYKLPVREPDGAYNRAALGAAAAALAGARGGGMSIPPAAKKAAAKKLVSLYTRFRLPVPDSLKNMAM